MGASRTKRIAVTEDARKAAAIVKERAPNARPKIGIVLGSGLGGLGDEVEDATVVGFGDLPGFVLPTVEGHHGRFIVGKLGGVEVACLQGRVHLYEGHDASAVKPLVRTFKLLGCDTMFVTNAAGALDADAEPGQLMMITDHINFQLRNPLIGPNDDDFGPRFPAMDEAYDKGLRERLRRVAGQLSIPLREGVYLACLGPSFETPAEIGAFGRLGANAVGMSTVPEVIVARHCGMKVAGVSVLTNLAAGLSPIELSHDQTLEYSHKAAGDLTRLVRAFVADLGA